ncbi:MAG: type II toxin-antitoxin system RelB/DinJ family antitoxin [Bacteroidales bacterium]|nr:type II toxin-antitoxin system RelB/DinJ family antitoxin [Bacteroidales bacterium]
MSTTAISIRLDSDIKEQFDKLCKEFGISTNAAFNLFARTVVREKAIPFTITLSSNVNGIRAQEALNRIQALSAQEDHEWTDEEIDQLIANHRKH